MASNFEKRRLEFGDQLRRLREQAGLSGSAMAERLGWTGSKVSKVETGKQTASDSDVVEWCEALNASESLVDQLRDHLRELRVLQIGWRRQLRQGHQARQKQSGSTWSTANVVRGVATMAVPGVLQTADYARAVFTTQSALLQVPASDVDSAVAARLQRQQRLYEGGKRIDILIAEVALTNPVCRPAEMVAQVDRLVSVVGLPTIRFGIIPLYQPLPYLLPHSFWIFDDVVQIETVSDEHRVIDPDHVAVYERLADELWSVAATGDEARSILLACGQRWAALTAPPN